MRDLSFYGRVLLFTAAVISRSASVAMSLNVPDYITKESDKTVYDFICGEKKHTIYKEIICNSKEHGGLEVLNLTELNKKLKVK